MKCEYFGAMLVGGGWAPIHIEEKSFATREARDWWVSRQHLRSATREECEVGSVRIRKADTVTVTESDRPVLLVFKSGEVWRAYSDGLGLSPNTYRTWGEALADQLIRRGCRDIQDTDIARWERGE